LPDRFEQRRIASEIERSSASTDPFASAVRATRMPMIITDPRKADNPIVFVNDAFGKLTGYSREECIDRNCRFLQGDGTNPEDVAKLRDAVKRRLPVETDILNYRKDGSSFWNRVLVSPVFDEDGDLAFFFASQFDVTPERNRLAEIQRDRDALEVEIERRIGDLTRSEERLIFTLKAGRLGAWTLDLGTKRLVASLRCKANFGRAATDNFSYADLVGSIHRDDLARWQREVDETIGSSSGELEIEYRAITPAGEVRWIEVRGQVNRNSDGEPIGMAGVSIDITDRKRADEHRELLARELDHRVKNTLAIVQSIISQTLRVAPSLEEGTKMLTSRVNALASAHDVLIREGWSAANLHDLVEEALRPFVTHGQDRIRTGGAMVRLRTKVATTLMLALHELATNAAKYGALTAAEGFVVLSWEIKRSSPDERDTFSLSWQEVGGPLVVAPTRRGFGSRLLERALPGEVGGTASISYAQKGLRFDLTAALADIVETAGD